MSSAPLVIIACGAIARELVAVIRANGWQDVKVQCLPAELHNRPEKIPAAMEAAIESARAQGHTRFFAAYADCGTGGLLDDVLRRHGVERLPGAHCYAFFAGLERFEAVAEVELGTLYLTDFLVRHFDRLIIRGLGLDRHPELMPMYFGHYTRLVYLAQTVDPVLTEAAQVCAERLGLSFERIDTGYGVLPDRVAKAREHTAWPQN